jgi:hypothetical protein
MTYVLSGDLPALWRERAETLSTYGDPNSARISGYSAAYIGSLIKREKIPNAGKFHAPRVRRSDLPPKKQPGGRGRPANQKFVPSDDSIRLLAQSHHLKEKKK